LKIQKGKGPLSIKQSSQKIMIQQFSKRMSGRTGFSKLKIELGFSAPPKKKNHEKHHRRVWSRKACAHKTQVMPNNFS
jgi:hypothetical protein